MTSWSERVYRALQAFREQTGRDPNQGETDYIANYIAEDYPEPEPAPETLRDPGYFGYAPEWAKPLEDEE